MPFFNSRKHDKTLYYNEIFFKGYIHKRSKALITKNMPDLAGNYICRDTLGSSVYCLCKIFQKYCSLCAQGVGNVFSEDFP